MRYSVLLLVLLCGCLTPPNVVDGGCADGVPNGPFSLRDGRGNLMIRGTFDRGMKQGLFQFYDSEPRKVAEIYYERDRRHGPVHLWYLAGGHKLEARYDAGQLDGEKVSWFPDGNPRARFRYEQGRFLGGEAWGPSGLALPLRDVARHAHDDLASDETYYGALEGMIASNLPKCDCRSTSGCS